MPRVEFARGLYQRGLAMGKTTFVIVASMVALMCLAAVMLQSLVVLQRIAYVSDVRGDVKVQRHGSEGFLPLSDGSYVRAGDVVRTGQGSAVLKWVDGTRVRIASDTTLQVLKCQFNTATDATVSVFKLDVGRVWIRVRKLLSPRSKFEVITPTATAGVRGTVFYVEVDPAGQTKIAVAEGAVAVEGNGQEMLVPSDKMAVVRRAVAGAASLAVADIGPEARAAFEQLRDALGPYLSLRKPRMTTACATDGELVVAGRTEAGVRLTVNGRAVAVDEAGWFRTTVPAKPGQTLHLTVEAIDEAGYRTVIERDVAVTASPGA